MSDRLTLRLHNAQVKKEYDRIGALRNASKR